MSTLHDDPRLGPGEMVPQGAHVDYQGLPYRPIGELSEQGVIGLMQGMIKDESQEGDFSDAYARQFMRLVEPQLGWFKAHINDTFPGLQGNFADLLDFNGLHGAVSMLGGKPTL